MSRGQKMLYRYKDAAGVVHVVDELAEVPVHYRHQAEAVGGTVTVEGRSALESATGEIGLRALQAHNTGQEKLYAVEQALARLGWKAKLHLPSMGLGAGLVIVTLLGWSAVRRRPGRLWRLVLMGAVAAAVGGGYAGWLGVVNQTASAYTNPTAILDQAHEAAEAASEHGRAQERLLDFIDQSAR